MQQGISKLVSATRLHAKETGTETIRPQRLQLQAAYNHSMSISLTPAALARVRQFLTTAPDALGLRLGVKRTGCSGFGYAVELARASTSDDRICEQDGVRIYVDAHSAPLLDGTQIDFVRKGLNHEFTFVNPNATASCGCGESFTVEAGHRPL